MTQYARPEALTGHIIGDCSQHIWGMSPARRLRLQLQRAGIAWVGSAAATSAGGGRHLLLRANFVFDEVLVKALAASAVGTLLVDEHGEPTAIQVGAADVGRARRVLLGEAPPHEWRAVDAAELAGRYNNALRKRETPYLLNLDLTTADAVERRMFSGSYKGVTDFITKHVWPAPARRVTKLCALAGLTPNQVTAASLAMVIAAFWLFWHGDFALGLIAAWIMTFLDTVDGKLARVTLQSSKIGDVFDHGIDLIHPPFWWWAWIVGLNATGRPLTDGGLILTVIVVGYVLQRLQEGLFLKLFGIEMHIWRPFDSFFRQITARRNPNLLMLTVSVVIGRPDWGAAAVAFWTAACLLVHGTQIMQALSARRGGPIRSWLTQ